MTEKTPFHYRPLKELIEVYETDPVKAAHLQSVRMALIEKIRAAEIEVHELRYQLAQDIDESQTHEE